MPQRVVILGGYGHFGARISRALAEHGAAEIWIAGRRLAVADALARELGVRFPAAEMRRTVLEISDRQQLAAELAQIGTTIVIHAAGPFQGQDYTVAEACLEAGCHYVDLADSRRFVSDITALDKRARAANLLVVSGASTLPGLSSAVVDLLRHGMREIRSIETSIVPAGQTPRGRATIEAVLSYCGKPVRMLEDGVWSEHIGWQDVRKLRYPKFSRRVAVCDVPDLELFPAHYGVSDTVSFRAGPELLVEHLALRVMAWKTRTGLVRDWSRYAGLFERVSRQIQRFGSDTGGMQLVVSGHDHDGRLIVRRWDLIARSNHGPEIPCMPAIALTKKLLEGKLERRGAMPCIGLIGLEDFALEALPYDIDWNLRRVQ